LGWKKLGLERSLGTRLVIYADEATPKRRCTTCARSWAS
jgi:hypothetical protein